MPRSKSRVSESTNGVYQWSPSVTSYRDRTALKFSKSEFRKALELLFGEHRGLPCMLVGSRTIIVPTEAVEVFDKHDIKFTLQPVAAPGAVTTERIAGQPPSSSSR